MGRIMLFESGKIKGNEKLLKRNGFIATVCFLFVASISHCDGKRILMLPLNCNSHIIYYARLAEGLVELGHTVELFAPSNAYIPHTRVNSSFTITTYEVDDDTPFLNSREVADNYLESGLSNSVFKKLLIARRLGPKVLKAWEDDCLALLKNKKLMLKIKQAGFQFAIMEPLISHCYGLIPISNRIPYAMFWVSRSALSYRVPRLPSFVPLFAHSDQMTFEQRFFSFVLTIFELFSMRLTTSNFSRYLSDSEDPGVLTAYEILQRSALWFYLEDESVGYAKPNMPNTVSIGDVVVAGQTIRPLPRELELFLNESSEGAILVSFGGFFDHYPDVLAKELCDAFRRVKKYNVIWKLKNNTLCSNFSNIMTLPWIPQNDLLAHPKIRLLITHGGFCSMVEYVYHAKPAIIMPLAFDQPENAQVASDKGYGIYIKLSEFSADEMVSSINKIMENPEFTKNVQLSSAILRDKQNSPAERVSFMIDHVLKYGDRHLRTGAFHLWIFQYLMFDIFLAIVGMGLAVVLLFVAGILGCVKLVRVCKATFRKQKVH